MALYFPRIKLQRLQAACRLRALPKFTSWWGLSASEGAHAAVLAAVAEGRAAGGGQEQQGGGTQRGEAVLGEEGALQTGPRMGWELVLFLLPVLSTPLWQGSWCALRNTGLEGPNGEKGRKKRRRKGLEPRSETQL